MTKKSFQESREKEIVTIMELDSMILLWGGGMSKMRWLNHTLNQLLIIIVLIIQCDSLIHLVMIQNKMAKK